MWLSPLKITFIILVGDLLTATVSTNLLIGGEKRAEVTIQRLETAEDIKKELEDFLDESRSGIRANVLQPGAIRVQPLFSSEVANSKRVISKAEETGSTREESQENLKSILSITDRLIRLLPFLFMYSYDFQPVLSILLHVLLSLLISVLFHEI